MLPYPPPGQTRIPGDTGPCCLPPAGNQDSALPRPPRPPRPLLPPEAPPSIPSGTPGSRPPPPLRAPTSRGGRGRGLHREGSAATHTPTAAPATRSEPREGEGPEMGSLRGRAGRPAGPGSGGTAPLPDVRPAPAAASPLLFLRNQDGGAARGRPSSAPARPACSAFLLAGPTLPRADWASASAGVARGAAAGGGAAGPGPGCASRPGRPLLPRERRGGGDGRPGRQGGGKNGAWLPPL